MHRQPRIHGSQRVRGRSFRWSLTTALLLVALAPRVRAASPSESAAAQALYDKAKQLMAAGHYADACPKLEESQRLDPGTGTLLNLASCYEQTGRIASAWTKYLEAEASARTSGNVDRAGAAHQRAAALAFRLAKVVINVGGGQTQGLIVKRDGELVGSAQWGIAIPVDSGVHTIVAEAPGRKAWKTQVTVQTDGSTVPVTVPELETDGSAPMRSGEGATPTAASTVGTEASMDASVGPAPSNGMRIASFVAFGVGAMGVGMGTVFGLRSISKRHQADDECPIVEQCPIAKHDYVTGLDNDAATAKTLATIGFAVGGVGVAAGVTLFVLSNKSKEPAATVSLPKIRPFVGLGVLGVSGAF